MHEERFVQDVGAVVHLLRGIGVDLFLHLLADFDAGQTCFLALVGLAELLLLEAFQEVDDVGCVDTHALSQVHLQAVGVGAAEVIAECVDAYRVDHLNGLLGFLLLAVLLGSTCAQRDAGTECKENKFFHLIDLLW